MFIRNAESMEMPPDNLGALMRPLSHDGCDQTRKIGSFLKKAMEGNKSAVIYCAPARRCRETALKSLGHAGLPNQVVTDKDLSRLDPEMVLDSLLKDNRNTGLVVAFTHQDTIASLVGPFSNEENVEQIELKIAPGSVTLFEWGQGVIDLIYLGLEI